MYVESPKSSQIQSLARWDPFLKKDADSSKEIVVYGFVMFEISGQISMYFINLEKP